MPILLADLMESVLYPTLSPYEILDKCANAAFDNENYTLLQSNDLWLHFIRNYFPGEQHIIQQLEGTLKARQTDGNEPTIGFVKAEFIKLARNLTHNIRIAFNDWFKKLSEDNLLSLKGDQLNCLLGCEEHAADYYYMSRVLKGAGQNTFTPEELNVLKSFYEFNGLLHIVAPHAPILKHLLLSLYPDNQARQAALEKESRHDGMNVLHHAANSADSLKQILSFYPDNAARVAALEKKSKGNRDVLFYAASSPDSLSEILPLYPDNASRWNALIKNSGDNRSALFHALDNVPSLRYILSFYNNDDERVNALMSVRFLDGQTVLHIATPKNTDDLLTYVLSLYPNDFERRQALNSTDAYRSPAWGNVQNHSRITKILASLNKPLSVAQTAYTAGFFGHSTFEEKDMDPGSENGLSFS